MLRDAGSDYRIRRSAAKPRGIRLSNVSKEIMHGTGISRAMANLGKTATDLKCLQLLLRAFSPLGTSKRRKLYFLVPQPQIPSRRLMPSSGCGCEGQCWISPRKLTSTITQNGSVRILFNRNFHCLLCAQYFGRDRSDTEHTERFDGHPCATLEARMQRYLITEYRSRSPCAYHLSSSGCSKLLLRKW